MSDSFDMNLKVEVSADEWAAIQRRTAFLEAVVGQILSKESNIREWFSATELSALELPGLPASSQAIGQHARRHGWVTDSAKRQGRKVAVYHYSSLPNRAFEGFVRRIMSLPEDEDIIPPVLLPDPKPTTAEPQWVLPLMRIIRTQDIGTWQEAKAELANTLPHWIAMPTNIELRTAFERFDNR
jgi:hypothetical protein